MMELLSISLACGETAQWYGFGKLSVVERAATVKVINGQKHEIPARKTVVFEPSAGLKKRVNK